MKKIALIAALACAFSVGANASMDDVTYRLVAVGNEAGSTNSASYVLRGNIAAIYVAAPANATGTVTLVSGEQTIFSKACSGTNVICPRVAAKLYTGGDISYVATGIDAAGPITNTVTASVFVPYAVAGPVTAQVIQTLPASATNSYTIKVIYEK